MRLEMLHDIIAKNMQKEKLIFGGLIVFTLFGAGMILGGGFEKDGRDIAQDDAVRVVATFYPYADLAHHIGGEDVVVTQIVSDGAEVHEYEPSVQDVQEFLSADVVIVNGGGVDAWAEELLDDARNEGVEVVFIEDVVPFVAIAEGDEHHEEDEHGHDEGVDPHVWLDPMRMQAVSRAIAEAIIVKRPESAASIALRTDDVLQRLASLDIAYTSLAKVCTERDVYVVHNAFYYWELRYALAFHALTGITSEAEPSIQDIQRVITSAKDAEAQAIFFASAEEARLASTVVEELGVEVRVLSTLEGRSEDDLANGRDYFAIMEENFSALSQTLLCD